MFRSRKFYTSFLGSVAWSTIAADAVLSSLEAASFSVARISFYNVAVAAVIADLLSLCCIGFFAVQHIHPRKGSVAQPARARQALAGVSILLSVIALSVSLLLIILIKLRWHEISTISSKVPVSNWNIHFIAHIAVWSISCVSQFTLYSLCFWIRHTPEAQTVFISGPRDSVMSEYPSGRTSNNMLMMEETMSSSPFTALPSPTFSHRSSKSLNSFRESIRYVVRPATSRTTLISRPSFTRSINSDNQSCHSMGHHDGFDNWDTSSVSTCARDAVMQYTPSSGTTHETIPGNHNHFLSDLPEVDEELIAPPKMKPDFSRPPSPSLGNESHIHPLFRSESPVPAPAATPGTSIVASPLASQAIVAPPRSYSRMRSNSRTASPSPLSHAQGLYDRRANSPQSLSRSPSPPSRELTPPIPDFVLTSSPRSSSSGSRRVQLQFSPDR